MTQSTKEQQKSKDKVTHLYQKLQGVVQWVHFELMFLVSEINLRFIYPQWVLWLVRGYMALAILNIQVSVKN